MTIRTRCGTISASYQLHLDEDAHFYHPEQFRGEDREGFRFIWGKLDIFFVEVCLMANHSSCCRFDHDEMSLRGRIGAAWAHALHDPHETTSAARDVFLARFERDLDDDLTPAERQRRIACARRAYFASLALKRHRASRGNASLPSPDSAASGAEEDGQ